MTCKTIKTEQDRDDYPKKNQYTVLVMVKCMFNYTRLCVAPNRDAEKQDIGRANTSIGQTAPAWGPLG